MLDRVAAKTRQIRCAIYTRKSSEEGLEQEFNSLHAQREACEAYIASQRQEGWQALANCYDDGGFSGGSMGRPGLQLLLADINAGHIDIVVVYKVDRLTRSLGDFARMVEAFDAKGVSFVSVTQAFNTTSSMGRLTLNVLLSFAQFEREVTGERIRDKIAASKKKGLWMGGFVPMGYAAQGRTLAIVEAEAAIIRHIFSRFLALGSIRRLKEELDRDGATTRPFTSATNRTWGACPFSLGHLRRILTNPLYRGEIVHKGERFGGQHPAIVTPEIFAQVEKLLANTKREHRIRAGAAEANLLAGLLFDIGGQALRSDHAKKASRRYRYYVGGVGPTERLRIPAGEIEPLVLGSLASHLSDRTWLMSALLPVSVTPEQIEDAGRKAAALAAELEHTVPSRQRSALLAIVERIVIRRDDLTIALKPDPFFGASHDEEALAPADSTSVTIEIPARFVSHGQKLRLIVPSQVGAEPQARLDKSLIKALARAVTWYDDLATGKTSSMREIAEQEKVSERYVAQLLSLAFLAPRLVEASLEGAGPLAISKGEIARGITLPMEWAQQTTSERTRVARAEALSEGGQERVFKAGPNRTNVS